MMRTVEGPAPHQSHFSQHPADEFGSRNVGKEQKGYPQGYLSSVKLFQLLMETWRGCFGRCICLVGFDSCSWTVLSLSLFNPLLKQSLHGADGLLFP